MLASHEHEKREGAVLKVPETCELVSTIIHVFLFWETFLFGLSSAGREERRFAVHGCPHLDSIVISTFKSHQLPGNLAESREL